MKNAVCILLLSQSTPLIFMGDEFGNTQGGNNNPWCQDNGTCWLDWGMQKRNREILEFWKRIVAFRKEHPMIHFRKRLRLMDYISCGYPDLSYHGESAWRPNLDSRSRHVGIMLCGKYAETDRQKEDDFIYIAMNMHWESRQLALPRLPKGMYWRMAFATAGQEDIQETEREENPDTSVTVQPRSIAVFVSGSLGRSGRRR